MNDDVTRGYGTGAVLHLPDARDHEMHRMPKVAKVLTGILPAKWDLSHHVTQILNQGALPACVTFSTASVEMAYRDMEGAAALEYDPVRAYWDVGGDGRNGVPSARVLKYAQERGMPLARSEVRTRIGSYAFTRDPKIIQAALVAGQLVVIALMLPMDWWEGDSKGGSYSSSYHQVAVTGYYHDTAGQLRFRGPNSWGARYGVKGFYSVPAGFLAQRSNQSGAFYAFTTVDFLDGVAAPDPVRIITGTTDAAGVPVTRGEEGATLAIVGKGFGTTGTVLFGPLGAAMLSWNDTVVTVRVPVLGGTLQSAAHPIFVRVPTADGAWQIEGPTFTITKKPAPAPVPTPTPGPGQITGYQATAPVSLIQRGSMFSIIGEGFGVEGFGAFWGSTRLSVKKWTPAEVVVEIPDTAATGTRAVSLRTQAGLELVGPVLRVTL